MGWQIVFYIVLWIRFFFQVLAAIDIDSDGMIKIDHVHKVLELLGTEHIQLPSKQVAIWEQEYIDSLTEAWNFLMRGVVFYQVFLFL